MAGFAVLVGGGIGLGSGLEPQAFAGAVRGDGVEMVMRQSSGLAASLGTLALLEG